MYKRETAKLHPYRKDSAMKKLAATVLFFYLILPVSAFAQTEGGAPLAFSARLAIAGRFFGGFLLVMGVIFVLLLSTRRLAAWVDHQREKRNKHNT